MVITCHHPFANTHRVENNESSHCIDIGIGWWDIDTGWLVTIGVALSWGVMIMGKGVCVGDRYVWEFWVFSSVLVWI